MSRLPWPWVVRAGHNPLTRGGEAISSVLRLTEAQLEGMIQRATTKALAERDELLAFVRMVAESPVIEVRGVQRGTDDREPWYYDVLEDVDGTDVERAKAIVARIEGGK